MLACGVGAGREREEEERRNEEILDHLPSLSV